MASQQVEQIQEAKPKDVDTKEQKRFTQHLIHDCTLACNDFQSKDFDLEKAKRITDEKLTAMATMDGLQSMLVAQMLSSRWREIKSCDFLLIWGFLTFDKLPHVESKHCGVTRTLYSFI